MDNELHALDSEKPKPRVNIGTIGHVDNGKLTLSAAVAYELRRHGGIGIVCSEGDGLLFGHERRIHSYRKTEVDSSYFKPKLRRKGQRNFNGRRR